MLCYIPRWLFDILLNLKLCKFANRFSKFKVLYSKKNTSLGEPFYDFVLKDTYTEQTIFITMGDENFQVGDVISLYWHKE